MSLAGNQVILGDHEGAKMSLGTSYVINPSDSVVAMQEIIEDLEDKGQYQVVRIALDYYERGQVVEAAEYIENSLVIGLSDPATDQAEKYLEEIYDTLGTDRTVLGYEWIIGELSEYGSTYTRPVGNYFNKISRSYYEAGELEAAAESLESSLVLDLSSEALKEGFELLEDVYGGLGVERGLEGYGGIEGRRPAEQYTNQDVMTLYSKGKFLREAGHLDQALEIFKGLIRDNEQMPIVKYQFPIRVSIGDIYRDKNRIRESSEEYDHALYLVNQHVPESEITEELKGQIAETWMSLAANYKELGLIKQVDGALAMVAVWSEGTD